MKRKESFAHVLITYTVILLAPVVLVGALIVFLYMGRLERNFEELNTKTVEAADIRQDQALEAVLSMSYQLSRDDNVSAFLGRPFQNVQDRVNLTVNTQQRIVDAMVHKNGVVMAAVYSRVNDLFVGNNIFGGKQEVYETYFSGCGYSQEELFELLDGVKVVPIWLATDDYLVYCTGMRTGSDHSGGYFLAVIEKKTLLNTWQEVFGNLEIECAVLYRGQLLVQTNGFLMDVYEAEGKLGLWGRQFMTMAYNSRKVGGFRYIHMADYATLGGGVPRMIRSLILVVLSLIGVSVILARRKARHIRDMYTEAVEKTESLGDQLNAQVEQLNLQLLRNALRGYEPLPAEKKRLYLKSSRIRVLIFRPEENGPEEARFRSAAQSCFSDGDMELLYLDEKDMGCVCILGYASREVLVKAVKQLWQTLSCDGSTVHLGLSAEVGSLSALAEAGEQAGTALHYCTLQREDGGVVYYSEISEQEKEKVYYPVEKEAQLLRNIRMGMREKTAESLERIYQINFKERRLPGEMIRLLLIKMLNTVYTLQETVSTGDASRQINPARINQIILLNPNKAEAFATLRDAMLAVCDKCGEQKEGELRRRIVTYIEEHFRDPDLSLEKMAEDFDMSYHHLSRLFNECMQMNFSVYLAGQRLEYSTQLLQTTSLSVEQVATQAGFLQSGSFIRVFKKYYGITPGKYREEAQK